MFWVNPPFIEGLPAMHVENLNDGALLTKVHLGNADVLQKCFKRVGRN